ncbi:unnamed protein product [Ranitomeya imitator]|uniref:Ephrin RBD domain-containing protein n=1 Tax=Ranitomeya imitator TaxID=111125 RepID=A0ABN9MTM3_9NEOB|nr:unnamed protein product [Ranitomeya imitator]
MEAMENLLVKQIDEAATQGEVIIMGDFNYPEIDWGTETCSSSKVYNYSPLPWVGEGYRRRVDLGDKARFQDAEGYVLYPQIGDRLDLLCPRSEPRGPFSSFPYEYYKLYLVGTEDEVVTCSVLRTPNLLLTCDRPGQDLRFTIKFQEYSPNLWGHEFKSHRDYYIIGEQFCKVRMDDDFSAIFLMQNPNT